MFKVPVFSFTANLKTVMLITVSIFSLNVFGFFYVEFEPPRSTTIANVAIKLSDIAAYYTQKYWYDGIQRRDVKINGTDYSYLIVPGTRPGVVVLFHGILARKEFFLPVVNQLIKTGKPLPTLVIPDILGHGSLSYPEDHDFTVQSFGRYFVKFIEYIRKKEEPLIVLGHSMGGGICILLRQLEQVEMDGLILVSPAGFPGNVTHDFKARMDAVHGFPADFGSSDFRQIIVASTEPATTLISAIVYLASIIYVPFASPYETWVKTKMFHELVVSREQMIAKTSDLEILRSNLVAPFHLVWTNEDRMFDASRYERARDYVKNEAIFRSHEEKGSHLWLFERPHEAADSLNEIINEIYTENEKRNNLILE